MTPTVGTVTVSYWVRTNGVLAATAAESVTITVNTAAQSGTVSAANSTVGTTGTDAGRVTAFTSNSVITGISGVNPTLTVAAPGAINVKANTQGFSNTTDTLVVSSANSRWQVGDRLYYAVPGGNTAITGLTGNSYYYVSFANTTTISVSATSGGANVDITSANITSAEVHTIQGDTATGLLIVTGAKRQGAAHAGWVLRTEGTGGRAGRVQMETLVAMGSLGAQSAAYGTAATTVDASDDNVFHDS
jgi:hypothetical protein